MEIDTQNQFLQSSMNYHIQEARQHEILAAAIACCEHVIIIKGQVAYFTKHFEELKGGDGPIIPIGSTIEFRRDKTLLNCRF